MHGFGIYEWKDGRKYEGEYYLDKKHGFGKYRWVDGRMYLLFINPSYEGQWNSGKQNGKGKYIMPDGEEKPGVWENGKRITTND
jgi:hypothetical protein